MSFAYVDSEGRFWSEDQMLEFAADELGLELVKACTLCERPLPDEGGTDATGGRLCPKCDATARAHATLERNRLEEINETW